MLSKQILAACPIFRRNITNTLLFAALVLLGRQNILDAQVDACDLKTGHSAKTLGDALLDLLDRVRERERLVLRALEQVEGELETDPASLPALMEVVPSAAARAVWQYFHAAPEKTNEED